MRAADVVRRHARRMKVLRLQPDVVVDGYQQQTTQTIMALISVQPLSGQDVRNLPPGQNSTDWLRVWSDRELKTLDRLTVNGELFTVESLLDWSAEGKFWHGRVVRVRERA